MKKHFFLVSVILFLPIIAFAQKNFSDTTKADNAVYLELLGSGILYSINYDRIYENKISIRSGFSYIPKIDLGMAGYISPGYTLPLSISKLISIGADNHIELGVAHTFLLIENNLTNSFGPIIGFREQNLTLGGGLVRFSFTPMIFPRSEKLIYFTGGLSVGKSF